LGKFGQSILRELLHLYNLYQNLLLQAFAITVKTSVVKTSIIALKNSSIGKTALNEILGNIKQASLFHLVAEVRKIIVQMKIICVKNVVA